MNPVKGSGILAPSTTREQRKFATVSNGVKHWLTGLSLALALFSAPIASAQYSLPIPDVSIIADPAVPAPNSEVHLTAESSFLDLSNADITWSVDGKTTLSGIGDKETSVSVGGAGVETRVSVRVSLLGESASASLSLIPGSVDLLFDATGYTPPFYKGRSLSSPGTSVRLVAIPHIISRGGPVAAGNLIYTWRQDGEVLGSLSGRGRSSTTVPGPSLFDTSVIQVTVNTADGSASAQASVRIPAIDPGLTLYVNHPLYGVEYYRAVRDRDALPDLEATLSIIPYFVAASSPKDTLLRYDWSVNGTPLAASSSTRNEVTVNAAGASGPATISLRLTSPLNFNLDAQHAWTISFAQRSAGANAIAPSQTPTDAFHTQTN